MARSSTSYKPGQSGNLKGKPKLAPEVKQIRNLTIEKFHDLVNKYFYLSLDELKAFNNNNTPSLDLMVIHIITECIKKGDYSRLDFFLNRLIGPVKHKPDPVNEDRPNGPIVVNLNIPNNERD